MPGDARTRLRIHLTDSIRPITDPDLLLDLEFAFVPWVHSCRDWYSINRCCRRRTGHEGDHCSGFGANRVRWP